MPYVWLVGVVLLGAGLRLYRLGEWSLWFDEALTISDALHVRDWSIHHRPINYWLTRLVLDTLGVSEFSARLVPCLVGIATIPLAYWSIRSMFGHSRALLAALFFALAPWHIYWSQNARHFSLVTFVVLFLIFVFYRGFETNRASLILLSLALVPVAYLSHPSATFILPALGLYLLVVKLLWQDAPDGYAWRNVLLFGVPLLLAGFSLVPEWQGLYARSKAMRGSSDPLFTFMTLSYYAQVPVLVFAALGAALVLRKRDRGGLLLVTTAAVPIATLLVINPWAEANPLYVVYALPMILGLAAASVSAITERLPEREWFVAWGLAAVILGSQLSQGYLYFFHQFGDRPRWREAALLVNTLKQSGDRIVSTEAPVIEYYLADRTGDLRRPGSTEWLNEGSLHDGMPPSRRTWYIVERKLGATDPDGTFESWLFSHAALIYEYPAWTSARDRSVRVFLYDPELSDRGRIWTTPFYVPGSESGSDPVVGSQRARLKASGDSVQ